MPPPRFLRLAGGFQEAALRLDEEGLTLLDRDAGAGLTSMINQGDDTASTALAASSLQGTFYTPTGGGSKSQFPAAPAPSATGETGLDKSGTNAAQALAAALAIANETLDPPFPYTAQPFFPALLQPPPA